MSEPKIDLERIAALLDARLGARERRELLAELRASEGGFETLVEATAILRDLESGGEAPGTLPVHRPARTRWTRRRRWTVAAAGVGALAAAAAVMVLVRGSPAGGTPSYAALLGARSGGLPPNWDERPWRASRGEGGALSSGARAARVGALLVDLDVAVGAHDTASAIIAGQVGALVAELPGSAPVVSLYDEVARRAAGAPDSLAPLVSLARGSAAQLVGPEYANLGAWTEAARIAAARRDAGFFQTRASRRMLDHGAALDARSAAARDAFRRLRSTLRDAGGSPAWSLVEQQASAVLRELAQ